MSVTHIHERVVNPFAAFRDRLDAGRSLVRFVKPERNPEALVLALPRGGVPVALPLATAMNAELDLVIARKLPVPQRPESGFGAVAVDGTTVLNEFMVKYFALSPSQIASISEQVAQEVLRRTLEYRRDRAVPEVQGRDVYLVDDGLATGYTMVAAAKMVRKLHPRSLTLCVPVAPWDSLLTVEDYFERIYVFFVQEFPPFAVASFYGDFHDLSDDEVRDLLQNRPMILPGTRKT